jgi:hypothetical protein
MFKYLSEILSKFTPQQRILALGLLLFTIVTLTLGNNVINSINQSDKVLETKVKRLEISQMILLRENDSLSYMISDNQIQCARDIRDVRTKILEDLGILEREILNRNRRVRSYESYEPVQYVDDFGDTVLMHQVGAPIQIADNSEEMIEGLRRLKEKLKKDNQ